MMFDALLLLCDFLSLFSYSHIDALLLQCVYMLADLGCNLEAQNKAGETALHIMVQRNRVECVMGLLTKGAETAVGSQTSTPLHMAIQARLSNSQQNNKDTQYNHNSFNSERI